MLLIEILSQECAFSGGAGEARDARAGTAVMWRSKQPAPIEAGSGEASLSRPISAAAAACMVRLAAEVRWVAGRASQILGLLLTQHIRGEAMQGQCAAVYANGASGWWGL